MGYMGDELYATEVASPIVFGASTLVVDGLAEAVFYTNEFASPGASTLVVDDIHTILLYTIEVASPIIGAAVSTADRHIDTVFYATKVASPKEIVIKKVDTL